MNKNNVFKSDKMQIATEIGRLLEKKEEVYGDSVKTLYKEFGLNFFIVMLASKLSKIKNINYSMKEYKDIKPNFESLEDTLIDIAGYAILAIIEERRDDF